MIREKTEDCEYLSFSLAENVRRPLQSSQQRQLAIARAGDNASDTGREIRQRLTFLPDTAAILIQHRYRYVAVYWLHCRVVAVV